MIRTNNPNREMKKTITLVKEEERILDLIREARKAIDFAYNAEEACEIFQQAEGEMKQAMEAVLNLGHFMACIYDGTRYGSEMFCPATEDEELRAFYAFREGRQTPPTTVTTVVSNGLHPVILEERLLESGIVICQIQ